MELAHHEPLAVELTRAVRSGDLEALADLFAQCPELANARIVDGKGGARSLLHLATDWPGYFPNGPAAVRLLIGAGADPNVAAGGMWHTETPLHWAASTDDVDVAAALLDGGAELEPTGGSIGSPLENAVGYACWHVARLLVDRGARVRELWVAAALGLMPWIEDRLAREPPATKGEIDAAFWQACHGGQRRVAELLLGRGADINASPGYSDKSPLEIAGSLDTRRELLVTWLRKHGAQPANDVP